MFCRAINLYIACALSVAGASPVLAGPVCDARGMLVPVARDIVHACGHLVQQQAKKIAPQRVVEILEQKEYSLADVNPVAQECFKRPDGSERTDIDDSTLVLLDREKIVALFDQLGDVQAVLPAARKIDYILLFGSTVQNMRKRIQALVQFVEAEQLQLGAATQIIFLSGQRDLFATETIDVLRDSSVLGMRNSWQEPERKPKTEFDAARWIWDQANLPASLRALTTVFINAQKKEKIDVVTGTISLVRPTTADTVNSWIATKPAPGHCLCISSQPFVYYQELTARDVLHKAGAHGFTVQAIGPEATARCKLSVYLDNFARVIYTLFHNQKLLDNQPLGA